LQTPEFFKVIVRYPKPRITRILRIPLTMLKACFAQDGLYGLFSTRFEVVLQHFYLWWEQVIQLPVVNAGVGGMDSW